MNVQEEIMDLLKDNIRKLYFKFLLPSLGSAMVMSIYTLTDAVVVGRGVGADALAGHAGSGAHRAVCKFRKSEEVCSISEYGCDD